MNNKEFNNKLNRAFKNSTPDILEDIIEECKAETQPNIMVLETKKRSNFMKKRIISIAAAFAVVITATAVGFNYFGNRSLAKISLDVNPSFEIDVNSREKVTEIEAKNDDAKKVLGDMDLEGSNIDVAVNALVGSIYKNGFLNEASNTVLISVDGENSEMLQERLSKDVEEAINGFEVSVLTQSVSSDDKLNENAQKYGISLGKAKVIEKILALDTTNTKTFDQLAKLSINELNLILHPDDEITLHGSASEKAFIGAGNAKKAALKHAGVEAKDATLIKAEMDFDDGVMLYEIEFYTKNAEYEYEINAKDGSVINFEIEKNPNYEANKNNKTESQKKEEKVEEKVDEIVEEKAPTNNNVDSSKTNASGISKSKAKNIALKDAGVKESKIFNYKIEKDFDDGVTHYDIEFQVENKEYTYEINAKTGNIIDKEIDIDDDYVAPSSKKETSKSISESDAKSIALGDAGLKSSEIRNYQIEKDNDDGITYYEIEFKAGNKEYTYEINAKSGKIIDKEVDIDD